jgi:hypothetical protein
VEERERERGNQVGHSRNGLAVLVRKGRAITLLLVAGRSRCTKPPHPSNPSHEPQSKAACVQTVQYMYSKYITLRRIRQM